MFSRCWKICWRTLYPISNTATENSESGMHLRFTIILSAIEYNIWILPVWRHKKTHEKGSSTGKIQFTSRVEKEYMKPSYSASIGNELEDGLFDGNEPNSWDLNNCYFLLLTQIKLTADFLELALQFGMIMMFACAFPLAFPFAALVNNFSIVPSHRDPELFWTLQVNEIWSFVQTSCAE